MAALEPKQLNCCARYAKDPDLDLHSMTEEYLTYGHRLEPLHRRHREALLGRARRRPHGPLRGRAGRAARPRPRHLSLRHLLEPDRRRGLRRRRRRPDRHRRRLGHHQGLRDPGRRRAVPDRARGRDRRAHARARPRVRHHDRAAASLRLARPRCPALRGAPQRHDRVWRSPSSTSSPASGRSASRPVTASRGRDVRRLPLPPVRPPPRERRVRRAAGLGRGHHRLPAPWRTCPARRATTSRYISEFVNVPITLVGVGPGRDQVIWVSPGEESVLEAA